MSKRLQDTYSNALHTALALLSRRRHSREEVRKKLTARGFEPRIIEKVLAECEKLQYIDDETAADFFMAELVRKQFGLLRIRDAMRARGFAGDLTEQMIETHRLLEIESDLAAAAAKKKKPALIREPDSRKRREKLARFLRSRGFRSSSISAVLADMKTNEVK